MAKKALVRAAKTAPAAMAGPESRRMISASTPIDTTPATSCRRRRT